MGQCDRIGGDSRSQPRRRQRLRRWRHDQFWQTLVGKSLQHERRSGHVPRFARPVFVNAAQVSVIGRSDTVTATAGSSVRLANTGTDDDIFGGSNDVLVLNNAETTVNGHQTQSVSRDRIGDRKRPSRCVRLRRGAWRLLNHGVRDERAAASSAADWTNFAALQASHDIFRRGKHDHRNQCDRYADASEHAGCRAVGNEREIPVNAARTRCRTPSERQTGDCSAK